MSRFVLKNLGKFSYSIDREKFKFDIKRNCVFVNIWDEFEKEKKRLILSF